MEFQVNLVKAFETGKHIFDRNNNGFNVILLTYFKIKRFFQTDLFDSKMDICQVILLRFKVN